MRIAAPTGLVYFARPGDSAQYGTDLYRVANDLQAPTMKTFYPESCGASAELARSVPFVGNAALIFMNAPGMAHGASIPRDATQATRYAYQFYVGPPKDEYGRLIRRISPAQQAACEPRPPTPKKATDAQRVPSAGPLPATYPLRVRMRTSGRSTFTTTRRYGPPRPGFVDV